MLTGRERQILEWIDQDPMISQQELACRAGITRSSAAVHISNLMKKGYIEGKGYVLKKAPYAMVIGAVSRDMVGRAHAPLTMGDSNPGSIQTKAGGAAGNQAHYLRLLGVNTKLLTAFAEDVPGEQLRQQCREMGLDIGEALRVSKAQTATRLWIADEKGALRVSGADMDICQRLTPAVLQARLGAINAAQLCLIDEQISPQTGQYLAEHGKPPLFFTAASPARSAFLLPLLPRLHTLVIGWAAVRALWPGAAAQRRAAHGLLQQLLDNGATRVCLHLPQQNQVLCAQGQYRQCIAFAPGEEIYRPRALDAFMAALAWAHMQGWEFMTAARVAAHMVAAGAGDIERWDAAAWLRATLAKEKNHTTDDKGVHDV